MKYLAFSLAALGLFLVCPRQQFYEILFFAVATGAAVNILRSKP